VAVDRAHVSPRTCLGFSTLITGRAASVGFQRIGRGRPSPSSGLDTDSLRTVSRIDSRVGVAVAHVFRMIAWRRTSQRSVVGSRRVPVPDGALRYAVPQGGR